MSATQPPGVQTTVTCPGCGVAVAVGYPRCPRCQAPVPAAPRGRRATARDALYSGGTSVAPEGAGLGTWIAGGAVVVALAAGAVWLATRGEAPAPAAAADEDDDEFEADDDPTPAARPRAGAPAVPDLPAPVDEPEDAWPAARRALDGALRAERLWAKVAREGDAVVVESALCGDAEMWPAIAGVAATLRDAGITGVRCQEPHGALVFERGL